MIDIIVVDIIAVELAITPSVQALLLVFGKIDKAMHA
jgi:hypothetical protein